MLALLKTKLMVHFAVLRKVHQEFGSFASRPIARRSYRIGLGGCLSILMKCQTSDKTTYDCLKGGGIGFANGGFGASGLTGKNEY